MNFEELIDGIKASGGVESAVSGLAMGSVSDAVMVRRNADGSASFAKDVQDAIESRLPAPRRRMGASAFYDVESFVAAVNRWKEPDRTTLWVDTGVCRVRAILNDNPAGAEGADWRDFLLTYNAPHAPEWLKWTGTADKEMSQDDFASFIDANLEDVTSVPTAEKGKYPSPIELLEMARNLQIHIRGQFERKIDPASGTGTLVVKDEHETYSSKIWRAFPLALRVFDGGTTYVVEARIRFRISNGKAYFAFSLYRADEIKRDAFKAIRERIAKECEGCPVFAGSP